MSAARTLLGVAMACLLLAGCDSDMSDLESYVAEIKSRRSTAIEPIPQLKQYEAYVYEIGDRRDPFTRVDPQQAAPINSGPGPDLNRNREPLEEFPIDALRMVGTISTPKGVFALVKAPDNVIHRVTIKDHLGQNYGQITAINESEISLLELVPDGFGAWVQRPASLALTQ
jgi:type IV pilus assembly protein PilP